MKRWLGAGVVVSVVLALAWWMSASQSVPSQRPRVRASSERPADVGAGDDCERVVAELRAEVDTLKPLGLLDAQVAVASGQVKRVQGEAFDPALFDDEATVRRRLAELGVEPIALDCRELPCWVRAPPSLS